MQLTLFIHDDNDVQTLVNENTLARYLRFGDVELLAQNCEQLFYDALGLDIKRPQAVAKLLLSAELASEQKDNSYSLSKLSNQAVYLVQPISLTLHRDTITLSHFLTLSADEFDEATLLFNQHFAQDGITFVGSASKRFWFVGLAYDAIKTYFPQASYHQNIHAFQPTGEGAQVIKKIMNEAQMLLFEHKINHQRLENYQPLFNSIWIYGNGLLPEIITPDYDAFVGDSAVLKLVGGLTQIKVAANLSSIASNSRHLLMDVSSTTEINWQALFDMVKKYQLSRFTLYFPLANRTIKITLNPLSCFKFWRKPKTFEQLIQHLNHAN